MYQLGISEPRPSQSVIIGRNAMIRITDDEGKSEAEDSSGLLIILIFSFNGDLWARDI